MYTSPDDARSDLFLSAAVFLFGPLAVSVLLDVLPLADFAPVLMVLTVALPLAVTVLVPYLLIRYRKERLSAYGLGGFQAGAFGTGALIGVPLAIASIAALMVRYGPDSANLLALTTFGGPVVVTGRIADTVGRCLLAVYVTVKARDAFRQDYLTVREGIRDIGRWVLLAAGGAWLLLTLGALVTDGAFSLAALLRLLGLAGALALALRSLRGPSVTSRQVMLTPTVLLALGPFALSLSGQRLLSSVYEAALWGGVGLLVAALTETKRGGWGAIGLGLVIALLTIFQTV